MFINDSSLTASRFARRSSQLAALTGVLLSVLLTACTDAETDEQEDGSDAADRQLVEEHLATFDELDFDVFSNQKWDLLNHSHSEDVVVHWPEGRTTTGIDVHIEDLKKLFVYAPDTRIKVHPIKFGDGEYTSVTGIFEGTFTEPMPGPDGTMIPPTGKAFKLSMATVGHWKDGVMDEEYLFWDNLTYMQQLGLAE